MQWRIIITPRKAVRHPESETILAALRAMGYHGMASLTKGEIIEGDGQGDPDALRRAIEKFASRRANPIMQDFRVEIDR